LIIFTIKYFIRSSGPASVFGGADEVSLSIAGAEIENNAMLSAPEPVSEPSLCERPDLLSESSPELSAIRDDVIAYLDAKQPQIIEIRTKLNEMLSVPMDEQRLAFVKKQLSELSKEWLFSRTVFPEDSLCSNYKVVPGDRFEMLGKKFRVPYEILVQINNISDPRTLRAGKTIKVINGPFHCRVYRSAFTMDIYLQDTFVRSFSVGLGKPGTETPTGRWIVKPDGKLISPTWTNPTVGKTYEAEDPDYPLGSRWIGLEGVDGAAKGRTGFAIHGTKNPEEINRAVSRGCIRLSNDDVILLYNLLTAGVSQVIVVE
jgi:LysM repeat protein